MTISQADAEAKAQDFEAFHDMMWANDTKWTMELMQQKFADDLQVGFQGQWTKGLEATFAHWLPMKQGGLMKKHTTIGCEVITWSGSMVSFMDYSVMTTFEDKELFLPIRVEANWNEHGMIDRISFVLSKKYEAVWNGLVGSFLSAQQ